MRDYGRMRRPIRWHISSTEFSTEISSLGAYPLHSDA